MNVDDSMQRSQPGARGATSVVIASGERSEDARRCEQSVSEHTGRDVVIVTVEPTAAAVNRALAQLAGTDVVLLLEPCLLDDGWLSRLSGAAHADTNIATASALADVGTPLALADGHEGADELMRLQRGAAERSPRLRPRLNRAAGPCILIRREALELVGGLDEALELRAAVTCDLARRCVLAGLTHVAADDVLVRMIVGEPAELPNRPSRIAESPVLPLALEAAAAPRPRLFATIDARALDGALMGTQVHVLELVRALAGSHGLRLRVLVRGERIDRETLELLRELPVSEVLAAEDVDESTPRSEIFHRPQQAFSSGDVALALRLGERVVLNQLDLIAYRNPGYFDAPPAWEDYRRAARHGMSAAERVIVFSEHTRRELLSDALVDAGRIRVVPPGLDHRHAADPQLPSGLDGPAGHEAGFLLCLGTDFAHKNRMFALRLLAALRDRHGWDGSLILAGTHISHGSSRASERELLGADQGLSAAVIDLGPVSDAEKAWLMERAGAVVYPSVYEGFGLVPFEAGLAGVPCLFAAQSSLADGAAAEAATIVPWDPVRSAAAAYPLLSDPDARTRHVQKLVDAAGGLTWARAAERTLEAYREAVLAPVRDAATLSRDAADRERELTDAHLAVADRLIDERELVLHSYNELLAEVGAGRSLVGPQGSLPEDLQRALLALSVRPSLGEPLFGALAGIFKLTRALARAGRRLTGGG